MSAWRLESSLKPESLNISPLCPKIRLKKALKDLRKISWFQNMNDPAVITSMFDWPEGCERQCPTIKKFLEMDMQPSLVHVLARYLSNISTSVKFNGITSRVFSINRLFLKNRGPGCGVGWQAAQQSQKIVTLGYYSKVGGNTVCCFFFRSII